MIATPRASRVCLRTAARLCVAGLVAGVGCASGASGAIITDVAFFNSIPSTVIDFETDGTGSPVSLIPGGSQAMPATEYQSLGVSFSPSVNWVRDGNANFVSVQGLLGLGQVCIPGAALSAFTIDFNVPVRAFGLWIINNENATGLPRPSFTARNAMGSPLETAVYTGGAIDGQIGLASYGFLGIFATEDIASVTVTRGGAVMDNLTYSAVPAPGAGVLGALSAGALLARRRRPD